MTQSTHTDDAMPAMTTPTTTITRRRRKPRFIGLGLSLVASAAIVATTLAPGVFAQAQTTTTTTTSVVSTTAAAATTVGQTTDLQTLTVAETEGPYFKTNSPERTSLIADSNVQGTVLTITGQVLSQTGQPVANAMLDFWQANASGAYDNSGYTLRGHQYTDANGYYTLTTVVPGLYPGRTRHIHVKVQAPNSSVLTTQLFFPGEARNSTDGIFDPSLVLNTQTSADGTQSATFNFVVNAA